MGCHKIQGLSRGNLGIELTEVGLHRDVEFFHRKLKKPLFNVAATLMPKLKLSDEDVDDLATFLKSLKGRSLAEDPMSHRARLKKWANAARGGRRGQGGQAHGRVARLPRLPQARGRGRRPRP